MNKRQRKKQLKKKLGYNPPINKMLKAIGIALGESRAAWAEEIINK